MPTPVNFINDFKWGCSTAAYQIEGAPLVDGAGLSIWDRFSHIPGNVSNGDTGDVACDHYHRYKEDVALMKSINLQSYRFSIAWSRVLPTGKGVVNKAGLDFYDRLVDELLKQDIDPMVTLYHWDLPQSLEEQGGWLNNDIAQWFGDYAEVVFNRLDDRVKLWATINEPWVVVDGGYMHGQLAPGHKSHYEAALATHNLMLANAEAVRRYRKVGKHEIGLVVNLEPKYSYSQSPEDLAATQRADAYMNRLFLDPLLKGKYPAEVDEIFGDAWLAWSDEEVMSLKEPMDFIGINYYSRGVTRYAPDNWPLQAESVKQTLSTYTETDWEVCPEAFTDVLNWVKNEYGNPTVYITENGSAFYDPPVSEDGQVNDPLRQNYMSSHITAVHEAIDSGCDIRGYYTWSLMDNLEWAHGYSKRFGIIHVNYETLERTLKDSAKLYRSIIQSNGHCLNK